MDPDACLEQLLEAWETGDDDTVRERAMSLREWMLNKGFAPKVDYGTLYRILDLIACDYDHD